MTIRIDTFDLDGTLLSSEEVDVPPTEPTIDERLDALTDAVEALAFDLLMGGM